MVYNFVTKKPRATVII